MAIMALLGVLLTFGWRGALGAWVSLSDLQGDLSPDSHHEHHKPPPADVIEAAEFLQQHAHELENSQVNLSTLFLLDRTDPNDPNQPVGPSEEDLGMVEKQSGSKGRKLLEKAYQMARRIRSHEGNVVASAVEIFSPDNCFTKLLYLLYRFRDEDDFPYLPRKLGHCDVFRFDVGTLSNGIW